MCYLCRIHGLLELAQKQDENEKAYIQTALAEIEDMKRIIAKYVEVKRRESYASEQQQASNYDVIMEMDKSTEDKTIPFVYLVELKCKLLLNVEPEQLVALIRNAVKDPSVKLSCVEQMAYACIEKGMVEASQEALRQCIVKLSSSAQTVDLARAGTLLKIYKISLHTVVVSFYRQLMQISKNRDEAYTFYQECYALLETCGTDIGSLLSRPDMSWIVIDAWNHGVYFFKCVQLHFDIFV